jgi:hypothetical protein
MELTHLLSALKLLPKILLAIDYFIYQFMEKYRPAINLYSIIQIFSGEHWLLIVLKQGKKAIKIPNIEKKNHILFQILKILKSFINLFLEFIALMNNLYKKYNNIKILNYFHKKYKKKFLFKELKAFYLNIFSPNLIKKVKFFNEIKKK